MEYDQSSSIKISSLKHLVSSLKNGKYLEVLNQSDSFNISLAELLPYTNWSISRYTRNCIARDQHFELILLCWEKGQKTAIHCHNDQECWVKVIAGSFAEEIYAYDEPSKEMKYVSTEVLSQHEETSADQKNMFHSLSNVDRGRSMSLHLYMKPINKCRVYDEQTLEIKEVSLSYHSLEGKLV